MFPKPPRPVPNARPVAVQIVRRENRGAVDPHVLIVETRKPPAAPQTVVPEQALTALPEPQASTAITPQPASSTPPARGAPA
jgi:hypothetical protein